MKGSSYYEGRDVIFNTFLAYDNARFVMPEYQRQYSWRISDCAHLYDDLIQLAKNNKGEEYRHFFGNIVSQSEANFNEEGKLVTDFYIVDGQQRITTVLILYVVIRSIAQQQEGYKDLVETINKYIYLSSKEIRLLLKENDLNDFMLLLSGKHFKELNENDFRNRRIYLNYRYFYETIEKEHNLTMQDLFDATSKLYCVHMMLGTDDNVQAIFESLNSMGLALSEGDKVRNFIFMSIPNNRQSKCYREYWQETEGNWDSDTLTQFIQDYLNIKSPKRRTSSETYFQFKEYVAENNIQINALIEELRLYARVYKTLLEYEEQPYDPKVFNIQDVIHGHIYRLNKLGTQVPHPFLLELMIIHKQKRITDEELKELLSALENYVYRRAVCELRSNSLKNTIQVLIKELNEKELNIERIKYKLLGNPNDYTRFPRDKEFEANFRKHKFYDKQDKGNHLTYYTLERIECQRKPKDCLNLWEEFEKDIAPYTIEHIMPQTLSDEWKNELGDKYKEIHETWLHRIANLTITPYNTHYGNKSFNEKKNLKDAESNGIGYKDSNIGITRDLKEYGKWTVDAMQQRENDLTKCALEKIWPELKTSYKPDSNTSAYSSYILNADTREDNDLDRQNLTGKTIKSFLYKDTEYKVRNWNDMYVKIIKILFDDNRSLLLGLMSDSDEEVSSYLSSDGKGMNNPKRIYNNENIYLEANIGNGEKAKRLKKFFKSCGADITELELHLISRN